MKAVFAVDAAGGYSFKGHLPWKFGAYPDDANWYLNHTRGKKLIMGRKTYEAAVRHKNHVPSGSVVISSRTVAVPHEHSVDVLAYDTFLKWKDKYENYVVIGGWQLISDLLKKGIISKMCLTRIPHIHQVDQFTSSEVLIPLTYAPETNIETAAGLKFRVYTKR